MAQKIHRNKDGSLEKDPWKGALEEALWKVPFGREVPFLQSALWKRSALWTRHFGKQSLFLGAVASSNWKKEIIW